MGAVGKSKGVWSRVVVPTPQDLKMGIPNVLVLLTSYLLLPADVTADFDDGYSIIRLVTTRLLFESSKHQQNRGMQLHNLT